MGEGKIFLPSASSDTVTVRCSAPAVSVDEPIAAGTEKAQSFTIVIFGASGDLTERKLMPALYNLFLHGSLPERFVIIGCARTKMTDDDFRKKMRSSVCEGCDFDLHRWEQFATYLFYREIDYAASATYATLKTYLGGIRLKGEACNLIYYLAIPPQLYMTVVEMLGKAGLAAEEGAAGCWVRIVVEKPFGSDLKTAIGLNAALHEYFQERQIFRIDHFLAKETVQNVLMLRFANAIFEPVWNRNYIENVSIIALEKIGAGHRAGYYEEAGVIRDMFQNHLMQILATIAMEPPCCFGAEMVRDEKVKIFRALRPFTTERSKQDLILGQYEAGNIDGEAVSAYRAEKGVKPNSLTPTFAILRVFVDNWRWQGVPFFLTSGKRMRQKMTEIVINFKEVPHSLFRAVLGEHITANTLILGIQPDEKISLTFQTKTPGPRVALRSVTMDFVYSQNYEGPELDAYEKTLLDVINGDHTLFWRQDGIEQSWLFLSPLLEDYESCSERSARLLMYKSGSWGPEGAEGVMRFHKHKTGATL